MKNKLLEKLLKLILDFSKVFLKQLIAMVIIGVTGIMFYEAGKAEIFGFQPITNEYCEQTEKDLNQIINDLELELTKTNNGDVYGEE